MNKTTKYIIFWSLVLLGTTIIENQYNKYKNKSK